MSKPAPRFIAPEDVHVGMRVLHMNGYVLTIDSVAVVGGFVRLVGTHEPEPGVTEWVAWYAVNDVALAGDPA